jgi:hypothetical protein
MNWSNDTCPPSNQQAQEMLPRMGDNVEFNCPSCGRFRISGTAFEVIRSFPEVTRKSALDKAKKRSRSTAACRKFSMRISARSD